MQLATVYGHGRYQCESQLALESPTASSERGDRVARWRVSIYDFVSQRDVE